MANATSSEYALDILGQQPHLHNMYTQISLIYGIPASSSSSSSSLASDDRLVNHITQQLTRGLERLTDAIPWIAGQVVPDSSGDKTGIFKIIPLERIPRLTVKDLRNTTADPKLTIDALRTAGFPSIMLPQALLAPTQGEDRPVLMLQTTILHDGGMVLTFMGIHDVLDMTAISWIAHVLDRVCKPGEDITQEERDLANVDRRTMIKLLDGWVGDKNKEGEKLQEADLSGISLGEWAYFIFTASSLSALKTQASSSYSSPDKGYISTDDALTAFVFQSIVRARLPRLSNSSSPVTLSRAVDPRRFLGIHESYPGMLQVFDYQSFTSPQNVVDTSIGDITSQLRAALIVPPASPSPAQQGLSNPPTDIAYCTRLLATYIAGTHTNEINISDKERFPLSGLPRLSTSLDISRDIILSSWAKNHALWSCDFGLGHGTPEAVGIPAFMCVEGVAFVMPRKAGADSDAVVGICLRGEDMHRFKEDDEVKNGRRVLVEISASASMMIR